MAAPVQRIWSGSALPPADSLSIEELFRDDKLGDWNKHLSCHLKERLLPFYSSVQHVPWKRQFLSSLAFYFSFISRIHETFISRKHTHSHTDLDLWPFTVISEETGRTVTRTHRHTPGLHPSWRSAAIWQEKVILIVRPPVIQRKANPLNTGVHPTVGRLTRCILGRTHVHAHTRSLLPCSFLMTRQRGE